MPRTSGGSTGSNDGFSWMRGSGHEETGVDVGKDEVTELVVGNANEALDVP